MKQFTAAIIGCGGRSKPHIEAYKFIDNATIVACCDLIEDRRNERAKEFNITPYADAREMLEKEQPDIVHITTTPTVRLDVMSLVSATLLHIYWRIMTWQNGLFFFPDRALRV